MTYDAPSRNDCKMMPVLDIQVWCEEEQVMFMFYEKKMVSEYVIHRNSALQWNVKKVVLAGETARRLFNTSPILVEQGRAEPLLDKLRYKMMVSGYTVKQREIIISEGIARYNNVMNQVRDGMRPLYRSSSFMKEDRAIKKEAKALGWYGKRNQSVMFVQATPGEILRKEIDSVMKKCGFKVKVVEKSGRSVIGLLQRSDVTPQLRCYDNSCPVCLTGERGLCRVEGVGYKVWCVPCKERGVDVIMHGETGRTAADRCSEHISRMRGRAQSNLREHCIAEHGGELVQFGCEVVSKFCGDPLSRQIEEAMRIEKESGRRSVVMNDKREWVRPASVHIRAEQP